ncbi:MAG: hypothetical protein JWQ29_1513, partial [Phenylobacterium sp.]|nr:hypothetical protein [Phenylobacterium sp.]
MVDLTSLKAFAGSFEIRHPDALRTLKLQPEPPGAMAAGARDLARRGYLGFVRLARGVGHDDLALRLAPGVPLADCPVVIALGDTVEALTIAPDLRRFVAGLMAYADLADPERKLSEAELAGLVELADEFQGARYAKQVLDAV